ncbi:hypothetical protein LINGRAHAP2_LOCUS29520 [Linum grandiflorum]
MGEATPATEMKEEDMREEAACAGSFTKERRRHRASAATAGWRRWKEVGGIDGIGRGRGRREPRGRIGGVCRRSVLVERGTRSSSSTAAAFCEET